MLARVERVLGSLRSIAISGGILLIGAVVAAIFGFELFSSEVYIEVIDVSKNFLERGISQSQVGQELASQLNRYQLPANGQADRLRADLAYILNDNNKTKLLPALPETSQPLLINTFETIPQFVVATGTFDIRSVFDFFRNSLGRKNNRITVALIETPGNRYELRLRLVLKTGTKILVAVGTTLDEAVHNAAEKLAAELFPQRYLLYLFAKESHTENRDFSDTRALVHQLMASATEQNQIFLRTIYGDVAYQSGAYDVATSIYRQLATVASAHSPLLAYRLSQSLIASGSLKDGIKAIETARDADKGSEELHEFVLAALVQAMQADSSAEFSRSSATAGQAKLEVKFLDTNWPSSAVANNVIGVFLYQIGDPAAAQARFEKAIAIDSTYASAHNNLGVMLLRQNEYGAAQLEFELATAEDDRSGAAELNEGSALEFMNHSLSAAERFRHAMELDPSNPVCYICWANALIYAGRFDEALQVIHKGLTLKPDDGVLMMLWGLLLEEKGCYPDAAMRLQAASDGGDTRASQVLLLSHLGSTLRNAGRLKDAQAAYDREANVWSFRVSDLPDASADAPDDEAARVTGDDLEEHFNYAIALANAGHMQDADGQRATLDRYLWQFREATWLPEAFRKWAIAKFAAGDVKGALDAARAAAVHGPTNWQAHAELGAILLRTGDPGAATVQFELARLLGGDHDSTLLTDWREALIKLGYPDRAAKLSSRFQQDTGQCK